ncbi:hypothetical protein JF544_03335 [Halobacillus kuroshimensis]|uniref:Uncharacterized protein n=1 Tax=Halobacillus kuroshimensis TaxID=302481 RepID=A0ABS3DSH4_9BACI|nr:hypothetical protein [Halobacillus kuroshimensis]MBN8234261.1 hypothetical protein [Halobacillus kuroshimensis]
MLRVTRSAYRWMLAAGTASANLVKKTLLTKWIFGSRCSRRRHHRTLLVPVPVGRQLYPRIKENVKHLSFAVSKEQDKLRYCRLRGKNPIHDQVLMTTPLEKGFSTS